MQAKSDPAMFSLHFILTGANTMKPFSALTDAAVNSDEKFCNIDHGV